MQPKGVFQLAKKYNSIMFDRLGLEPRAQATVSTIRNWRCFIVTHRRQSQEEKIADSIRSLIVT